MYGKDKPGAMLGLFLDFSNPLSVTVRTMPWGAVALEQTVP